MRELRCNHVHLGHPHMDHSWEMQPGMDPVHCPGLDCPAPVPDPRELGLQWEDRITDAVHPAGGRTWTYQERSDLVLDVVRELLHERLSPYLDMIHLFRGCVGQCDPATPLFDHDEMCVTRRVMELLADFDCENEGAEVPDRGSPRWREWRAKAQMIADEIGPDLAALRAHIARLEARDES